MKNLLLTAARFTAYLLSGVILALIFVGLLFLTNGFAGGYLSLAITLLAVFFFLRWIYKRQESIGLKVLKSLPAGLALILIIWSMIPLPRHEFRDTDGDPGFEMWNLNEDRSVSVNIHNPPDDAELREETIVFVHGGPGAYNRDFDRHFLASFSDEGYRVLMYDQAGAGRSPLLPITEYSHMGNVDDLRAILQKLDSPVILFGQSYGSGVITSFMDAYGNDFDVRKLILSEPSPLPGVDLNTDHPHFTDKTTKAESADGLEFSDVVSNPRVLLAALLPAGHSFVSQEEMIGYIGPELQVQVVSNSYCMEDAERMLPFEPLPVNILATLHIRNDFTEAHRPDLRELPQPVLLLLGACSYVPRGFAMEYFEHYTITRSHWIENAGHILWTTPENSAKTYAAIMSFLNDTEPPLPNRPDYDTRIRFIEDGF